MLVGSQFDADYSFDELTHFLAHQFFDIVTRKPLDLRCAALYPRDLQPGAASWVADFFSWWIDPESGYPLPERAGVLRYFIRIGDKIERADRAEELAKICYRARSCRRAFTRHVQ
jgi:hypothetical protein